MNTTTATPLAVKRGLFVPEEATVQASGYFYAVDMGEGISPRHHRVGKDSVCSCYLGDQCPAVEMVQTYLSNGGQPASQPPLGYFPVAPMTCPVCGAAAVYDQSLSSKQRGAGWRCTQSGAAHYWQIMGQALAEKFKTRPWVFPPVVIRDGKQVSAQAILETDAVLYPGVRRVDIPEWWPDEPEG